MPANELSAHDDGSLDSQADVQESPAAAAPLIQQIVKTEANLLRLPLFALHTKRLKTLDGIECRGRIVRDGQSHQFVFRATRNTATMYPGPLARSAHLAFLSIATEAGVPIQNPITWTWRDLCRRMGVKYSGREVSHLKESITATAALLIHSEHALYSKPNAIPIHTSKDALHLYDRVLFCGSQLPDGTRSEANFLWLSDWYLQNLNALFTAPLDYGLWRSLDEHSSIASRLYEFLLLNFYSAVPSLRINYETLAQFLPVKPERYLSDAKKQMEPAFELLVNAGVITSAEWRPGKNALALLVLHRGRLLPLMTSRNRSAMPFAATQAGDEIRMKELRNLRPAGWHIVTQFYKLWAGADDYRPTAKELEQASDIIEKYGSTRAAALIPLGIERLRRDWPNAKTFSALARYLPDVVGDQDKKERRRTLEQEQAAAERAEEKRRIAARLALEEQWKPRWENLSTEEQEEIRSAVLAQSRFAAKTPSLLERLCLLELARQSDESIFRETV
jgi:hypothetical protein